MKHLHHKHRLNRQPLFSFGPCEPSTPCAPPTLSTSHSASQPKHRMPFTSNTKDRIQTEATNDGTLRKVRRAVLLPGDYGRVSFQVTRPARHVGFVNNNRGARGDALWEKYGVPCPRPRHHSLTHSIPDRRDSPSKPIPIGYLNMQIDNKLNRILRTFQDVRF